MRYAENSSSTKAASICQARNKTCAACCALLPTPALPRAVGTWLLRLCRLREQLRCCATTFFASSRARRVVAVWEVAVDERGRHSQREEKTTPKDNPPSMKRVCRVSLVASTMLLLHGWAEMLRCAEPHVVQGGSENLSEALSGTAWCFHPPAVEYQYL